MVLCSRREISGFARSNLRISTDSGKTFGPGRLVYGDVSRVAVASAKVIVVSASAGSESTLLRSVDGGRNFTRVHGQERTASSYDRPHLAFATEAAGSWIDPGGKLWPTEDAGATWIGRPFD